MSTGPDADQAVPYDTPSVETSPWVLPGTYTVRLTAGTQTLTQPLEVAMDPRIKTSFPELGQQFTAAKAIYDDTLKATAAIHEITVLREQLKRQPAAASATREGEQLKGPTQATACTPKPPVTLGESLETNLDKIAGRIDGPRGGGGRGGPAGPPTLASVRVQLARLEHSIQNADAQPTAAQMEAYGTVAQPLPGLLAQWEEIKATQLKALNDDRGRQHLPLLTLNTSGIDHDVEDQIELGDEP